MPNEVWYLYTYMASLFPFDFFMVYMRPFHQSKLQTPVFVFKSTLFQEYPMNKASLLLSTIVHCFKDKSTLP